MNIVNKVTVTICGKEYNLQTDETPDYLISLAKRVDKEIGDLVKAKPNFGVQNAAVFVALTSLDEAQKAADSIENVRTQIKAYVEETAKARKEKEKLADKNKALEEKIAALEKEIKELKKRPSYECEQLVLENTISPAVTIYAEENVPEAASETEAMVSEAEEKVSDNVTVEKPAETAPEKESAAPEEPEKPSETVNAEEKTAQAPAQTAECGSDASKSSETQDSGEHGGADGGTGAEAQNDGGNTQDDNLTPPPQNRKSRKKRR
ncbi:MAG: cell division protein ZapA [Huintestinicola sp.]|uniref:cell division protein ZapA n=1 Tax=Huintestinicola sp. TaxID=2981661 RepID=UPI003F0CB1F3